MQKEVCELARQMATMEQANICDSGMIPIVFCPVEQLEHTLAIATSASFIATIRSASEMRFQGWMLWSVHQEVVPDLRGQDGYQFDDFDEILPWWSGLIESVNRLSLKV